MLSWQNSFKKIEQSPGPLLFWLAASFVQKISCDMMHSIHYTCLIDKKLLRWYKDVSVCASFGEILIQFNHDMPNAMFILPRILHKTTFPNRQCQNFHITIAIEALKNTILINLPLACTAFEFKLLKKLFKFCIYKC